MDSKEIVQAFQQRLKDLGWYSGTVDGTVGTLTEKAVVAFKTAAKLNPRPFVGVVTMHALFDDDAPKGTPSPVYTDGNDQYPWMVEAKKRIGIKETPGTGNNPVIMQWAKNIGQGNVYKADETSWCGLFVGDVIHSTFADEKLPTNPLGARQWLTFGVQTTPGVGAILVFWRGSRDGWQGHVGFYVGEDATNYYVLGGNQSDSVNITKVAKNRLLGARAPKSVIFIPHIAKMSAAGEVSHNEE